MRQLFKSTIVLFIVTSLLSYSSYTKGENSFSNYAKINAVRSGFGPNRITKINIQSKDGWFINKDYHIKVSLDDKTLGKNDGVYNSVGDNKSTEVLFKTKSTSAFGDAKVAFCNATECMPAVKIHFPIQEK